MAKQKKSAAGAAEKQLKAAVSRLQAQLRAAEKSAEKWKTRAKAHKSVASGVRSELGAVRRRLEKTEASVTKWKDRAQARVQPGSRPHLVSVPDDEATEATPTAPATGSASPVPDDTWTVAALRVEARRRGLTGYSRKSKAELLAELRG